MVVAGGGWWVAVAVVAAMALAGVWGVGRMWGGGGAWLGLRRLVEWNGKKRVWREGMVGAGGGVAHSKQPRAPSRRIFARKGRTAGPKRRRPVPPDGTGTTTQQPRNAARRTITMVEATLRFQPSGFV